MASIVLLKRREGLVEEPPPAHSHLEVTIMRNSHKPNHPQRSIYHTANTR